MSNFNSQQISPPEYWQEFEKLCADLWEEIWNDPHTQLNGRGGQEQHGVDVSGRLNGNGDWQAVQCKGKDGRYGKAVTEAELRDEVNKAKNFKPSIKAFVLATTAQNDAKIQKVARSLTDAHKKKGLFSVVVVSWDEILRKLAKHPKVQEIHFPDQSPALFRVEKSLKDFETQLIAQTERSQAPTDSASDVMRALRGAGVIPNDDGTDNGDPADEALNREIDSYRDLIFSKPATALELLQDLSKRNGDECSNAIRFRIITNIGAAYSELAEFDKAADHYLEAVKFADDGDPRAIRNKAFAHLLNNDYPNVIVETNRAIALEPDNAHSYALLIAASSQLDETITPEKLIPKDKMSESNILFAVGHSYQRRDCHLEALKWFKKAYDLDPDSIHYKATYGSELMGSVLTPLEASMEGDVSDQGEKDLELAVKLLGEVWETVGNGELAKSYLWAGINLANGIATLGHIDDTNTLIKRLVDLNPENSDIRRLGALMALRQNKTEQAQEHLSHVVQGTDPEVDLLRSQTLAEAGKYDDALEAIDALETQKLPQIHISAALGLRIRLLVQTKGLDAGLTTIKKAEKEHPKDLILRASIAKIYLSQGNEEEATNIAKILASKLPQDASRAIRMTIADLLYDLELLREASGVYQSLLQGHRDTQTLRRLLICLFNTDQRKAAVSILEELPDHVRKLKFFRRLVTVIYIRSGAPEKALEEAENYLEQEPEDLEVRLYWIGILQRHDHDDSIKAFLADVPDYSEASSIDQIQLSHMLVHYGFHDKGFSLRTN